MHFGIDTVPTSQNYESKINHTVQVNMHLCNVFFYIRYTILIQNYGICHEKQGMMTKRHEL